jgi:hypothetical protein
VADVDLGDEVPVGDVEGALAEEVDGVAEVDPAHAALVGGLLQQPPLHLLQRRDDLLEVNGAEPVESDLERRLLPQDRPLREQDPARPGEHGEWRAHMR